jgi:hypothetical protein
VISIIPKQVKAMLRIRTDLRFLNNSHAGKLKITTTTELTKTRFSGGAKNVTEDRAVVLTVTWKLTGVELRFSDPGTVQVAAGGAPEQEILTLPLNPCPPIVRL